MAPHVRKLIGWWIALGCFMFAIQVMLGGITRLTNSGLSITQWKPISGVIPPLNEAQWNAEFDLYKQQVQYQVINQGMTLHEFKWIFFWEYSHRLWARSIAVIFFIPFVYFLFKGYLDGRLIIWLVSLFLFGSLQGFVGWIMVKGGLTGLFVPPIRLTTHLILALILIGSMLWLSLSVFRGEEKWEVNKSLPALKKLAVAILVVLSLQIFFGGLTSGTKAGLAYPTWPDMNGQFIPSVLTTEPASVAGFMQYNPQDYWARTIIQVLHRFTAYILIVLVLAFFFIARNITTDKVFKAGLNFYPIMVLLQATLGIITVLNCRGHVPVSWGVIHQTGAMLLLSNTVFIIFHLYNSSPTAKR